MAGERFALCCPVCPKCSRTLGPAESALCSFSEPYKRHRHFLSSYSTAPRQPRYPSQKLYSLPSLHSTSIAMGNSTSRPTSPSSSRRRLDRKDSFSGLSQSSTVSATTLINSNDHSAPTYRSTQTTFTSSSDSKHPLNDFISEDDPKVPDTKAWGSRSTFSQSSSSFNPYGSEQPPPYVDSARKSQIQAEQRWRCRNSAETSANVIDDCFVHLGRPV